jgi:diamine N-acetyltransferase
MFPELFRNLAGGIQTYSEHMGNLTLEELSGRTIVAANNLTLKPGQEAFLAPPSYAVAEAYFAPDTDWPRVVLDGSDVVGFIRGHFDKETSQEEFQSCIWRIHIAAEAQGRGVGRFAVEALAAEARSRGFDRITVLWEPGDNSPGDFFHALGFVNIGETRYGETIAALSLT